MNRSKRNETNQNPLPSIRLKSYRNETRRIERNRIEIGFCRFDIIEEILGSIRLLSIRFVSIDSRRSIQPSLISRHVSFTLLINYHGELFPLFVRLITVFGFE